MTAPEEHVPQPADAAPMIEVYYEKGWTDGLPVVPPSEDSVGAMLAGAGLQGEDVVGEIAARHTRITADKVAINAVLAGCLPEYMPVVVAAVKGICHEDYGYHGPSTSTGGAAVAMVVNGPIAARLGINGEDNVFGPGFRPNATIGRAVRLLMMNAINTRPGKLDKSTLGNPGKYTLCFAENEANSPWEPLHVERGFKAEDSAVTVFATEGSIQVYNQLSNDAETLCKTMADAMANLGSINIVGQQNIMAVWAGEHAAVFRKAGWSKKQVQQCLFENAKRTVADIKRVGKFPLPIKPEDEETYRHVTRTPEEILVLHAGAPQGAFSTCLPGWGSHSVTRAVTIRIETP
ncbi:MAG: hypothetical protein O7A67_09500 [SAR324 cluster bacterium]|nr:hypothetical protein [SAR324 cluster bacterium]